MASPCSSAPGSFKYDVFLSFRGQDTRKTFTSHLHEALVREQINTYIDNEIERGKEIKPALLQAIEKSKLFVVILSQDYASSTWCLDELAHILECKERYQQSESVIPIFYGVDPSHVRCQSDSYAAAFVQHEKDFNDTPDKVLKWRDALKKASNLAGYDSLNFSSDSELIKEVLKDIMRKLNSKCLRDLTRQDVGTEFRSWQLINGRELDRAKDKCYTCRGIGHWAKDCPSNKCFKCGGIGHWAEDCPSNKCFKCDGIGHWAKDCPSACDEDSPSADKCFTCGGIGHWAEDCPSNKCFKCGGIGHWAKDCASNKCFKCGGIGHWAKDCPSAGDEDMQGQMYLQA